MRFPFPQAVSLLLFGMLALMIGSSLHKKLAYDEYPNLYYGYRFMTEGPSAVPDGQRMPVFTLHALGCAAYQCDPSLLDRRPAARFIVRLPSLLFALLLGYAIYAWARELYGPRAALFSLALYVFNPNFIAHGKQITSDSATCLFFFLSIYFFWRYSRDRKRVNFILSAFATTAAIVSKYSGILIFAVLLLLWSFRKIQDHRKGNKTNFAELLRSAAIGLGFFLMVLFLVNSVYLFKDSFTKTNEIAWQSKAYQKLKKYSIPIPFPKTFTLGMDYTKFIQENPAIGRGNNYILGKRHRRGRWYSFPLMILLKTPLAFFPLLLLAAFARKSADEERAPGDSSLYLFVPFLLWLVIFSTLCDIQLGVRYVLPAFVFLIVYAGKAARGTPGPKTLFLTGLLL
ncbi:MAG TPA: glycosyltransferase family 39 protein [bacterium]|nr:glycosyltransferase family 39 protein [bacterium]